MPTELERFRDHARRMASGKRVTVDAPGTIGGKAVALPSPEERAEWKRLADEADDQIRRDADDEGLWEAPTVPDDTDPGLW